MLAVATGGLLFAAAFAANAEHADPSVAHIEVEFSDDFTDFNVTSDKDLSNIIIRFCPDEEREDVKIEFNDGNFTFQWTGDDEIETVWVKAGSFKDDSEDAPPGAGERFEASDCEEDVCVGPENVQATAEEGPQNRVTWDDFEGAIQYNIYRAVGNGSFELIDSVDGNTTEYVDVDDAESPVVAGVTYRYQVSALIDEETETERCETAEVTAIPVLPTLLAGAMAMLGGVGAYAMLRRRRGA